MKQINMKEMEKTTGGYEYPDIEELMRQRELRRMLPDLRPDYYDLLNLKRSPTRIECSETIRALADLYAGERIPSADPRFGGLADTPERIRILA